MATTTTITKILFRRGNDEDREQTILASGEPGWVLDTKRLWVGDGTTGGGYPIPAVGAENASQGRHLWFVDYELSYNLENKSEPPIIGQGQQFLDINVPGLSNTLAGKTIFPIDGRWFHPARDDITTNFNLVFENKADGRNDAEIRHTGSGELKIYSSSGGNVNINDSLFVRGDGVIQFESDTFVIKADKQIFDEGAMTHFEDKSIDFNVVREVDGTNPDGSVKYKDLEEGQAGATAEGTGIYFAHENYLSAGHVAVGNKTGYLGWGTIEIQPPVYTFDWEEQINITGRSQDGSATDGWRTNKSEPESSTGWRDFERKGLGNASGRDSENGDWRAKPLIMHSLRPSSLWENNEYQGFAHLMFESGLLVYDDAGRKNDEEDVRALGISSPYNAYRINQSVDTRATPVFSGIKIRAVDGISDGDPFDIQSGGTGKTKFRKSSIVHTTGAPGSTGDAQYTTDPLESTPLALGEIFVGTEAGPTNWTITTNNWLTVRSDVANHPLRIENKFAPDYLANDELTRKNWFVSFGTITTDEDDVVPVGTNTEPKHTLNTKGDFQTHPTNPNLVIDNGHIYVAGSNTSKTIAFSHFPVGTHLYNHGWDNNKKRGSNELSPGIDEPITYAWGEEESLITRTRLVYAGDTNSDLEDAVPHTTLLIDVSGGSGDTHDDITPVSFKNTGHALGALRINREGHVIGIRSKDFDQRYMQNFNVGTRNRKTSRIDAPVDYAESVNTVVDGNSWAESILGYKLDQGETQGSIEWLETYFNGAAVDSESLTRKIFLDVSGVSNTGHSRNSAGYRDAGNPNKNQMNVVTGLEFNDYGTVYSYDTHNLTDVYYDKQQVGWLGLYLDTKVDGVSAAIDDIDYFSTWDDSATVDKDAGEQAREIRSTWRNNSSIHFTHNSSVATGPTDVTNGDNLVGSYIRINPTDSGQRDWDFDAFVDTGGNRDRIRLFTQPANSPASGLSNGGLEIRSKGNPDNLPEKLLRTWSYSQSEEDNTWLDSYLEMYSSIRHLNTPIFRFVSQHGDSNVPHVEIHRERLSTAENPNDNSRADTLLFDFAAPISTSSGAALTIGEGFDRTEETDGIDWRQHIHIDANVKSAAKVWIKAIGDDDDTDATEAQKNAAGSTDWHFLTMSDFTAPMEKTATTICGKSRDDDMERSLYVYNDQQTRPQYGGTNDVSWLNFTEATEAGFAVQDPDGAMDGRSSLKYKNSTGTLATPNLRLYQNQAVVAGQKIREGGNLRVDGTVTIGNEELVDRHTFNGKITFNCDYSDPDSDEEPDNSLNGLMINGNVTIAGDPGTAGDNTAGGAGYTLTVPDIKATDVNISTTLDIANGASVTFGNQTQGAIVLTQNSNSDLTTSSTMVGADKAGKILMGGTGGPDFGTIQAKTVNDAGTAVSDSWLSVVNQDNESGTGSNVLIAHTGSTPTAWSGSGAHANFTTDWATDAEFIDRIVLDAQGHVTRVARSKLTREVLKLDEDQSVKFNSLGVGTSSTPGTNGVIWAANDIVAFYGTSDERLKKDVSTIDDALETVNKLRGVRFKYNDVAKELNPGVTEETQMGVIAQELLEHVPEVTRPFGLMPGTQVDQPRKPEDTVQGVRYENLTALLIEAVKQLSAKVTELESKLAN